MGSQISVLHVFLASDLCRRDSFAISDGVSACLCVCLQSVCVFLCMCVYCVVLCVPCVFVCVCVRTCVFSVLRLLYPVTLSHLSWCPAVFPAAS